MQMRLLSALAVLLLPHASLSLPSLTATGKLTVLSSVGSTLVSNDLAKPLPETELPADATLRLSFTVTEGSSSDSPVQPRQAFVSWQSKETGQDWTTVLKVRKSGACKFELDLSRAPNGLVSLPSPVDATLLLADSSHEPLAIPLATFITSPVPSLENEAKKPSVWEADKYGVMKEIHWTFKDPMKPVSRPKVIAGVLLVLAPWAGLPPLLSHLNLNKPNFSLNRTLFLLAILTFELLTFTYWVQLKLLPTLKWFGLAALLVIFTGRTALGELRSRRLKSASKKTE